MKFGKEFKTHLEQTLPEWRDKFLCYKPLKKLLKHYPNLPSTIDPIPTNHSLNFLLPPLQPLFPLTIPPMLRPSNPFLPPMKLLLLLWLIFRIGSLEFSMKNSKSWMISTLIKRKSLLFGFRLFSFLLFFPFFVLAILLEYIYTICVSNLGLLCYCFFCGVLNNLKC